jgi:glucose-6-phosphate 1-dehydrogenase
MPSSSSAHLAYKKVFPAFQLPYERLLEAAANGDPTLFAREDAVEESWRIVNPILGDVTPLYQYTPGTWGPPEVDRLVLPDEGWRDPVG